MRSTGYFRFQTDLRRLNRFASKYSGEIQSSNELNLANLNIYILFNYIYPKPGLNKIILLMQIAR